MAPAYRLSTGKIHNFVSEVGNTWPGSFTDSQKKAQKIMTRDQGSSMQTAVTGSLEISGEWYGKEKQFTDCEKSHFKQYGLLRNTSQKGMAQRQYLQFMVP
jgi:hypothetical protein